MVRIICKYFRISVGYCSYFLVDSDVGQGQHKFMGAAILDFLFWFSSTELMFFRISRTFLITHCTVNVRSPSAPLGGTARPAVLYGGGVFMHMAVEPVEEGTEEWVFF